MKVKVPAEVAAAFDYHENAFKNVNANARLQMYMAIPSSLVHDQALVLQEFARQKPFDYIKAVLHGYEPQYNLKAELAQMIDDWLSKPYVENEKRDVQMFAERIIDHFQQKSKAV